MKLKTLSANRTHYQLVYINIEPDFDYSVPCGHESITALPGHVVIQMVPPKEKQGSLYLPQEYADTHRNDLGVVVSVGTGIPLFIGDLVAASYGHGKRVIDFYNDHFTATSEMVFTGCAGGVLLDDDFGDITPSQEVPWWESIIMKIEGNNFLPTGRNLLLKLDPVESIGSIQLFRKQHQCDAVVSDIGEDAFKDAQGVVRETVKVGDRVVFDDGAIRQVVGTDYIVVPDFAIHAIV